MFSGCYNLVSLDLSNFDTRSVTDMSNMFSYCYKLEKININNFNTSLVKSMRLIFFYCKSLKDVEVSSFYTKNILDMLFMFYGCVNLEFLNITNFEANPNQAASYESMFDEDEKLHLIITSIFYNKIISSNKYLKAIEKNVTIID